MNRKDITRMCSQAINETKGVDSPLFRFAALVAAAEREAVCRLVQDMWGGIDADRMVDAIRARGQHD